MNLKGVEKANCLKLEDTTRIYEDMEYEKRQDIKLNDNKDSEKRFNYIDDREAVINNAPEINWADIDLVKLKENIEIIRSKLKPDTKFMAVAKGDAYGHGLIPIGRELEKCCIDAIGVVRVNEALGLRTSGIRLPIVILSPIHPLQAPWVVKYQITPMIENESIAEALEESAKEEGVNIKVHLKVNTGLNRYGIETGDVMNFIQRLQNKCPHVIIEGIYTHFRDAEFNAKYTNMQIKRFNSILEKLEEHGIRPPIIHAAASGGILMYPNSHYNMVRCGIIMYGFEHNEDENSLPLGIKPLMSLKSLIMSIRDLKAGEAGGYGDMFIPSRDSKVAVIGMGYGDGISRGWKEVLIAGQRVPVVNYFMDGVMVDITDVKKEVRLYEEAVLVGTQGNETITWKEACHSIGGNIDEELQRITERVPKNYLK